MQNENISISLADAINEHCRNFEGSEEFHEMVSSHVRKLYEKAIEDTFRWGKFPDAVKKSLEDALPANLSEMVDLPKYNLLLARTLNEQWQENATSERLVSQMQALVKDFIEQNQVPKFIKASDLWCAYVEQYEEEAAQEGWSAPTIIINNDDERWGKFFQIGLDKEEKSTSGIYSREKTHYFQCETYLAFRQVTHSEGGKDVPVMNGGDAVYSLYTGQLEHSDALGKKPVQFRTKFEKLVGALYYGDSLLVLDESDADNIYYPNAY